MSRTPALDPASRRGILFGKASFDESSEGDFETMARRRYQEPKPKKQGRWWYLLYWQDGFVNGKRVRKRKRVKLAPADMKEREVRKIAAEHLRPLNQALLTSGSATTFGTYVDQIYQPTIMPLLASSTQDRYARVLKNHLKPAFGDAPLRDVTLLSMQRYFAGLGRSALSHESIDKLRDVLASVLRSAVEFGCLVKNPIAGLRLPPPRHRVRSKRYVTPQQFEALVALIREPYATMVHVAVYTGLRVSELIGLRWRNVHTDSITIEERYCRGDWGAPKSSASGATIAVNRRVIERIQRLRQLVVEVRAGCAIRRYPAVKRYGPDELVFQSVISGKPMRDNNVLVRHVKPAGRTLGIEWVNWLVLRRSFATWLKIAGADVKDAQALMRHSRASTTLDFYQQFVPESQRRVVDSLDQLVSSNLVH
jgi:integrase